MGIIVFVIVVIILYIAITSPISDSKKPRTSSVNRTLSTTAGSEPGSELEEEDRDTSPSMSPEEAIMLVREAGNGEPWMDKMRRKYPVYALDNGEYEVRIKGHDGHTYTCRCSESPGAEEYGFILVELQYKESCKDYV